MPAQVRIHRQCCQQKLFGYQKIRGGGGPDRKDRELVDWVYERRPIPHSLLCWAAVTFGGLWIDVALTHTRALTHTSKGSYDICDLVRRDFHTSFPVGS